MLCSRLIVFLKDETASELVLYITLVSCITFKVNESWKINTPVSFAVFELEQLCCGLIPYMFVVLHTTIAFRSLIFLFGDKTSSKLVFNIALVFCITFIAKESWKINTLDSFAVFSLEHVVLRTDTVHVCCAWHYDSFPFDLDTNRGTRSETLIILLSLVAAPIVA